MDLITMFGNLVLFALVFGMSATVDINALLDQLRNQKAIMTGIFCQFVVLPMLGFLVVSILELDYPTGITLLVVTSSPGGSYSNWWCSMFNADLALSVTMTAVSTILSICVLPANLLLYTRLAYQSEDDVVSELDWNSLFVALFVVITAICFGLMCSYSIRSTTFNKRANQLGNLAGATLIIFSAALSSGGEAESKIWSRDLTFYVGVSLPCILGLLIANAISTCSDLKHPERVTVAIECCYQNVGIATSLALTMFDGQDLTAAMGVPFFYGMIEGLFIGCYCVWAWKAGWTKAPADAPWWRVLFTSYEVIQVAERLQQAIEVSLTQSEDTPNRLADDDKSISTYYKIEEEQKQPTEIELVR